MRGSGRLMLVALGAVGVAAVACSAPPAAQRTATPDEAAFAAVVEERLGVAAPAWWSAGDTAVINEGRLVLRLSAVMQRSDAVNACGDLADAWAEVAAGQPSVVGIMEVWVTSAGDAPLSVKCAMVVPEP